jgi:FixJ family two-component response regulator
MDMPYVRDKRFVEHRQYDVKQLWESHHEMIRRIALGQSNVEVAEALNVTPQTVSNIRNSPLAREKVQEFVKELDKEVVDISKRIQEFAPKALQVLEEIIEGRYEEASLQLRARTAESYMSRAGFGPVHKAHIVSQHLTREDIDRIKVRALEAARLAGTIDVEYTQV